MSEGIEALLRHPAIWRAESGYGPQASVYPTGYPALDQVLPGGGWPRGAITELLIDHEGIGELGLLAFALSRIANEKRWIVCIAPPHILYAPALAERGVDISRVLVARGESARETLWTAEQALKAPAGGAVLLWQGDQRFSMRDLRRLQLAAETGSGWGVLFRNSKDRKASSTAALRLLIEADTAGLAVTALKCRGGVPGKRVVIGCA